VFCIFFDSRNYDGETRVPKILPAWRAGSLAGVNLSYWLQSIYISKPSGRAAEASLQETDFVLPLTFQDMKLNFQLKQTLTLGNGGFFDDHLDNLFAQLQQAEKQVERGMGKRGAKAALKSHKSRFGRL
jgi:hypothetical protein